MKIYNKDGYILGVGLAKEFKRKCLKVPKFELIDFKLIQVGEYDCPRY